MREADNNNYHDKNTRLNVSLWTRYFDMKIYDCWDFLLKKIYKGDVPWRAVFKIKTLFCCPLLVSMEMMNPIPTHTQIALAWLKHVHSFDCCQWIHTDVDNSLNFTLRKRLFNGLNKLLFLHVINACRFCIIIIAFSFYFSCILLINNHMILFVQFGIN